jgi:hypothetical protein
MCSPDPNYKITTTEVSTVSGDLPQVFVAIAVVWTLGRRERRSLLLVSAGMLEL